jgi:hypothetical protein
MRCGQNKKSVGQIHLIRRDFGKRNISETASLFLEASEGETAMSSRLAGRVGPNALATGTSSGPTYSMTRAGDFVGVPARVPKSR